MGNCVSLFFRYSFWPFPLLPSSLMRSNLRLNLRLRRSMKRWW